MTDNTLTVKELFELCREKNIADCPLRIWIPGHGIVNITEDDIIITLTEVHIEADADC